MSADDRPGVARTSGGCIKPQYSKSSKVNLTALSKLSD